MPTFTLQQIVDEMRKHPRSIPTVTSYIAFDSEAYKYDDEQAGQPKLKKCLPPARLVEACAIGEATLQLARLAWECVEPIIAYEDNLENSTGNDQQWALKKCVPETNVERELLSSAGVPVTYGFWSRAEYWFCFAPERIQSRVKAIKKAAREFQIPLT